jgi:hypothetical protein
MTYTWKALLGGTDGIYLVLFPLSVGIDSPVDIRLYLDLRRRKPASVRFSSLSLVRDALPKQSKWKRHLPFALFLLAMSSLIMAMARPVSTITSPPPMRPSSLPSTSRAVCAPPTSRRTAWKPPSPRRWSSSNCRTIEYTDRDRRVCRDMPWLFNPHHGQGIAGNRRQEPDHGAPHCHRRRDPGVAGCDLRDGRLIPARIQMRSDPACLKGSMFPPSSSCSRTA